ncbi:MAG: type II secretion system F family protein [Candidatus Micrarchaeota archaeon]|nr:type II secretion system F family protein [Candidatus Micrarchaeota archaeon]
MKIGAKTKKYILVYEALIAFLCLLYPVPSLLVILGTLAAIPFILLFTVSERNKRFIESVLPDVLDLTASNIRAGLTPERALMVSARPEFGELSKVIKKAAKKMMTGTPAEKALQEIGDELGIHSVKRAFMLISEGMRYGGDVSSVLEEVASEMRDVEITRKESRSVIIMYTTFIFIATVIGSPLLFGVSSYMVEIFTKLPGNIVSVSPEFLYLFSLAAVVVNSVFGSLMIGLIYHGRESAGLRFLPILVILSVAVFVGARTLISGVTLGILPP